MKVNTQLDFKGNYNRRERYNRTGRKRSIAEDRTLHDGSKTYRKSAKDICYASGTSATSQTYGNVIAVVREEILKMFQPDFFKYDTVSTELLTHTLAKDRKNSLHDIEKKEKPKLIIRPTIDTDKDSLFLANTDITSSRGYVPTMPNTNTNCLFRDADKDFKFLYKINRDRINFDINIKLETFHQQIDVYNNLRNLFRWDTPSYLSRTLEAVIPKNMLQFISNIADIPIYADSNKTDPRVFLNYLRNSSVYPITYKMRNSTANDEFFMYYYTNILAFFSDLEMDDGSQRNMVDDTYNITFRMSAEFTFPAMFLLVGSHREYIEKFHIDKIGEIEPIVETNLFTLQNLFTTFGNIDGKDYFDSCICNIDNDSHGKTDITDISSMFAPHVRSLIRGHYNDGVDPSLFMLCNVTKNNMLLIKGKEWDIDLINMKLSIFDSNKDATYRFIVNMDIPYVSSKMTEYVETIELQKNT